MLSSHMLCLECTCKSCIAAASSSLDCLAANWAFNIPLIVLNRTISQSDLLCQTSDDENDEPMMIENDAMSLID